jgi:hypothetical protein
MNLQLKRVIQNWEKSGQGSGGFIEEDDVFEDYEEDEDEDINNDDAEKQGFAFGSLADQPPQSLELRHNEPPYLIEMSRICPLQSETA